MRYAFYCHGGSMNHGCEAIIRTLSDLIKSKDESAYVKVYTFNEKEDKKFVFDSIDEFEEFKFNKKPENVSFFDKLRLALYSKQNQSKADRFYYTISCRNPGLKDNDVYISVGGDNYCYGDNHVSMAFNQVVRSLGKKTVLWGCSIGEENLTEEKIEDLKGYDLIVARETITYNTLLKHGINKNTVLYPDSAFTLGLQDSEYNFKEKSYIAVNIGNILNKYVEKGISAKDYATVIVKYILDNTDYDVVLIPHVTRPRGDLRILDQVKNEFETERVKLVSSGLNAMQYKKIISGSEAFVGSRTHATIAAYSTFVPTFVIGYSVKSIGIANDIFTTNEGLVASVKDIGTPDKLVEIFAEFFAKRDEYREYLKKVMPDYTARAFRSINELFKI